MAAVPAIFDIAMDRVIVPRHRLEREVGIRDRPAGDIEPIADLQILGIPALREAVLPPIEPVAHRPSDKCSTPSPTSRSISAAPCPSSPRIARPCSPMAGAG